MINAAEHTLSSTARRTWHALWSGANLSPAGLAYFKELVAEYQTLPQVATNPQASQLAARLIEGEAAGDLTANDVRAFETALIAVLAPPDLRRRALALIAEYRDRAGTARYEAYLKATAMDLAALGDDELRAYVRDLLREVHRADICASAKEERFSEVFRSVLKATLLVAATVAIITVSFMVASQAAEVTSPIAYSGSVADSIRTWLTALAYDVAYMPHASYVIIFGALGAFVSVLQRLQSSARDDSLVYPLANPGLISVKLVPLIGGVAAFIFFVMLAAEVVQGELFPKIVWPDYQKWLTLGNLIGESYAATKVDFAKLMIWSFLAGFSERLVPDILTRLSATAGQKPTQGTP